MFFGRSPIVTVFFFMVFGLAGLFTYSYTIGGDSAIGYGTTAFVEKVKERLPANVKELKMPKNLKLPESLKLPEELQFLNKLELAQANRHRSSTGDPDHVLARDACFDEMFYEKDGTFFTQSRWGSNPVPYQLKGLEMVGPDSKELNETDIANGIDQRLTYELKVESYRRFTAGKGWESWQSNQPPEMNGMTLIRQDGIWKVADSPSDAYSVR